MSTLFSNLSEQTKNMEAARDTVGGIRVFDSNIYDVILKLAYVGQSKGGANFMSCIFTMPDNSEYREDFYFTSSKEKGQKPYFEKNGKNFPLPGYTVVNDLLMICAGTPLEATDFEEKTVNVYDAEAKKELPKSVMVPVEALNKPVSIGLQKVLEIKQEKDNNGNYVDTDQTRETNSVDKVFDTATKLTIVEAMTAQQAGKDAEPVFYDTWLNANKDKVRDNTKQRKNNASTGTSQAPAAAGATTAPRKSLFGK